MSKKYILSAKIYVDDLPHITFKHLFKSSPSSSCNIWNHKSFFTTQLLCIFLAQTLHTFYKIRTSKWKFLDFPLLALKFIKFLMSFFKQKLSLDHISVSWEIILQYHLAETLYAFDKSSTSKCKFSDLSYLALNFTKFLMSVLEPIVSLSSDFASFYRLMRHNSSVFFHLNLYILWILGAHQGANFQTFGSLYEN